jgi:serine protease
MLKTLASICCLALLSVSTHGLAASGESGRVIVKYRSGDHVLRQAAATGMSPTLAQRTGLRLQAMSGPAPGTEVLRSKDLDSQALASRLAREPEVEYAVPDRRRLARTLPNDALFSSQWYLQSTEAAAINMVSAWDRSKGANGTLVAVIDTGVRRDHPDLAGKIVGGYDFIADAALGADDNGRDADYSDPGDYIDANDRSNAALIDICGADALADNTTSSWHGTRVSGLIAAATDNAIGIAGAGWNIRLLALRVLGKCGGYDSDIIAAMRWAAGLTVPGVPENQTPARVINLSLSAAGACEPSYTDAINAVTAKGVLIVAAAGNSDGPVESPANCPGVLGVAGLRHVGTKVGYSSFGPEVGISAPAGNCVNVGVGEPCLFSLTTTLNNGATAPGENTYSTPLHANYGTSFSAPLAAATAALMFDMNEALTPAKVISRIKSSATAFPTEAGLSDCPMTNQDAQCNCTTATCGAGMLNAASALAAVALPSAAIVARDPLTAGATIRLDGSGSQTLTGHAIVTWDWTVISAPEGARVEGTGSLVSLIAPYGGTYRIRLRVVDDAGEVASSVVTLAVAGAAAPSGDSGGGGALDGFAGLGLLLLASLIYRQRSRPHTAKAQKLPPR